MLQPVEMQLSMPSELSGYQSMQVSMHLLSLSLCSPSGSQSARITGTTVIRIAKNFIVSAFSRDDYRQDELLVGVGRSDCC